MCCVRFFQSLPFNFRTIEADLTAAGDNVNYTLAGCKWPLLPPHLLWDLTHSLHKAFNYYFREYWDVLLSQPIFRAFSICASSQAAGKGILSDEIEPLWHCTPVATTAVIRSRNCYWVLSCFPSHPLVLYMNWFSSCGSKRSCLLHTPANDAVQLWPIATFHQQPIRKLICLTVQPGAGCHIQLEFLGEWLTEFLVIFH